mgnify:CR=1 FL=1
MPLIPSVPHVPGALRAGSSSLLLAVLASGLLHADAAAQATIADANRWGDYLAGVRAAEQHVAAAIVAGRGQDRTAAAARAEAAARQALAIAPDGVDARVWLAVALGLKAEAMGGRDQLRMGREAHELALAALAADPEHACAHHVVGRVHGAAMRMSGMARFLAGRILGSDLARHASWDQAEQHLRRAAELEPDAIQHPLELAKVLKDRGRADEARTLLLPLIDRHPQTELDRYLIAEAAEELEELAG